MGSPHIFVEEFTIGRTGKQLGALSALPLGCYNVRIGESTSGCCHRESDIRLCPGGRGSRLSIRIKQQWFFSRSTIFFAHYEDGATARS